MQLRINDFTSAKAGLTLIGDRAPSFRVDTCGFVEDTAELYAGPG
jgi:hypothetical protein